MQVGPTSNSPNNSPRKSKRKQNSKVSTQTPALDDSQGISGSSLSKRSSKYRSRSGLSPANKRHGRCPSASDLRVVPNLILLRTLWHSEGQLNLPQIDLLTDTEQSQLQASCIAAVDPESIYQATLQILGNNLSQSIIAVFQPALDEPVYRKLLTNLSFELGSIQLFNIYRYLEQTPYKSIVTSIREHILRMLSSGANVPANWIQELSSAQALFHIALKASQASAESKDDLQKKVLETYQTLLLETYKLAAQSLVQAIPQPLLLLLQDPDSTSATDRHQLQSLLTQKLTVFDSVTMLSQATTAANDVKAPIQVTSDYSTFTLSLSDAIASQYACHLAGQGQAPRCFEAAMTIQEPALRARVMNQCLDAVAAVKKQELSEVIEAITDESLRETVRMAALKTYLDVPTRNWDILSRLLNPWLYKDTPLVANGMNSYQQTGIPLLSGCSASLIDQVRMERNVQHMGIESIVIQYLAYLGSLKRWHDCDVLYAQIREVLTRTIGMRTYAKCLVTAGEVSRHEALCQSYQDERMLYDVQHFDSKQSLDLCYRKCSSIHHSIMREEAFLWYYKLLADVDAEAALAGITDLNECSHQDSVRRVCVHTFTKNGHLQRAQDVIALIGTDVIKNDAIHHYYLAWEALYSQSMPIITSNLKESTCSIPRLPPNTAVSCYSRRPPIKKQ